MNPSMIRFHHFTSKKAYCKLQEIFGTYDERRNFDSIEKPHENFDITYYEYDELFGESTYKVLSFRNDFLIPGISNLKKQYFKNFTSATYVKGLFSQDLLDGFSKHHRNELTKTKNDILKAKYLEFKIKMTLHNEINKLEFLIDDFIANPYSQIKEKIQFIWNRTDVEYFFYLLRENKTISWIEDADLGKIIDATMECSGDDGYMPIKDSRKHLNAFKNVESRSQGKANSRLKRIFMSEDFFNL